MKLLLGLDDLRQEHKKDGKPVDLTGLRVRPTFEMLTESAQEAVKIVGIGHFTYPEVSFGDKIDPPDK